ncbi:MAG TPA: SDR family NAD(P)-dependent oxidoreductase, partial [Solirubrobacteraceae bacterium]|nr:SDR family NAD(P)-dependent oxidoreductase [Solirubrobacteraceae bacterium]
MQVEGSSTIVFGGASGLGEASARRLHEHGARVTIADLNEDKGGALADELGDDASFVKTDVTKADDVEAAVAAAAEAEGGLRINVCCAGVGWAEKLAGKRGPHQLQPFETVIGINLIGTFNALRFAAVAMLGNDPNAEGERGV